jgi:AraC family transcriptional regulator, transcriptional activator of pobA
MKDIPIRKINSSQKEPFLSKSFDVRDLKDLLAGKHMIQELHRHDFFYILALKRGTGNHEIDFTSYKITDHSMFFMRPGQVHQLTLNAKSTGYLIEFKNDFYHSHDKTATQLLRKASGTNFYQFDVNRFKRLLAVFTSIFTEHERKQEGYQEIIKANLNILFIELARQDSKSTRIKIDSYSQKRLEEFLGLLETHVYRNKQVSLYAEMMNLSPYQLNAITKTLLDKTASTLINEQIILESKRFLLATSNQVNQIADHLGYEDVSYFIRFFKKHTGYTPDSFRHNFK